MGRLCCSHPLKVPMPAPLVSVIIPAYNRRDSIGRAIDSVLAQTLTDFELIVVDDASTDDTVAVVAAYTDPRMRLIRRDANGRAAAARNTGIRAATGRYVAFLDSDDSWTPDKLEIQLAALASGPDEMRASCTGYFVVADGLTVTKIPTYNHYQKLFLGCDLSPGSTLVVRRDVYSEVGLNDEAFYRYEDWDWVLRYTRRFTMGVVPEPLATVYRGGFPTGASMAPAAERLLAVHHDDLKALGKRFHRKVAATRWLELSQLFFKDRDFRRGSEYLMKGLAATPLVRPSMYVLIVDALFGTNLQGLAWRLRKMVNR